MSSNLAILKKYFGYNKFRPGQEEIINSVISGKNVLAILPTGGGKSICYQVPAMLSKSFSIVISPLIALMKDQVDSLNSGEKIAGLINSSIGFAETEETFREIQNGKIKILYVSPEKLENSEFVRRINSLTPEYLFIDEAHCISQWGHNFRPSYTKIREFAELISVDKISGFTATATPLVREDIIRQLKLDDPQVFIQGFERDNISIHAEVTKYKKEKTAEILSKYNTPAIIYCSTRKNTEELVDYLRNKKINAQYYHAGLTAELRRIIQDDFIHGRLSTIVATNAFGMGIDKQDIRTIIHFNMPGSIESYYQEIGRAGRDAKPSDVFLLYELKDTEIQRYFIDISYPTKEEIEYVYDAVYDQAGIALGDKPEDSIPLNEKFLAKMSLKNLSSQKLNSALKILDESGYLKQNSNFHKNHYIRFILNQNELQGYLKKISNNFNKEILITLLREYGSTLFNSKTSVNIDKIAEATGNHESEIITILDNLSKIGIIEYDKPTDYDSVKVLESRVKLKNLRINFTSLIEKKKFESEKLQAMVDFVYTEECRFNYILEYFGEEVTNYKCGKCDICTGIKQKDSLSNEYIEEIILNIIEKARIPYKEKSLIKILLGKSKSPPVMSNPNFGKCANYKKEDIEKSINSLISKGLILKSIDTLTLTEESINKLTDYEKSEENNNSEYEKTLMLFNKLREARKQASIKYSQNANLICREDTLRNIARSRPVTPSEFLAIEGANQRMYNKIGDEFIEIIKEEIEKENQNGKSIPENIIKTLELVKKGYTLADISTLTRLPEAVVSMQIETILEYHPGTDISSLISKKEIELINNEIENGITNLKELKSVLPNSISYGKIRIVLAKGRN